MMTDLVEIWRQEYAKVPAQLTRLSEVGCAVTAFNTNIDAVIKISGKQLSLLAQTVGLSLADLQNTNKKINAPQDAVRGIIRCFTLGIGEEWLCENIQVDRWINDNLGYSHLQMGGQAGITANVLAVLGVQKVYAHTASHPQIQAKQFINADNLWAFDENGKAGKAVDINRQKDLPLIHRIIEFNAGDTFVLEGQTFKCPKANRFIATYDPDNMLLKMDDYFVKHINNSGFDYMILSGFHSLTASSGGLERIDYTQKLIRKWKAVNPSGIIHLELASTQDKAVRQSILEKIAPVADSVGLNEREALEVLEVIAPDFSATVNQQQLKASVLLDILMQIKEKIRTPRIQLHFYGMYLTLQDKNFAISAEQNKRGMLLAATVAASKAGTGSIEKRENILWAQGKDIGRIAAENMQELAQYLHHPAIAVTGLGEYKGFDLIAVPTILVEKPLTLVGMGDTISAVSLIGAR